MPGAVSSRVEGLGAGPREAVSAGPADRDAVIELRGLAREFRLGETVLRALDGVDLTIRRGEFVAIMGSSGSGKSTLMNVIGCLDRPSSGTYLFEGRDVGRLAEPELADIRSGRIGFVFQSFNLLPRTTALENVVLPLLYGEAAALTARARRERGLAALAQVGLGGREHSTPSQLSGGQQQRVALARALINRPAVLLADEPTGNLDTRTSHEIMDLICALNREQGVTVVLVTHEADIGAYAQRLVTMRDGRIVSDEAQTPRGREAADGPRPAAPPPAPPEPDGPAAPRLRAAFLTMVAQASLQALLRNRMRSLLTMLGVFIGVAALIAMVAVGDGASAAVRKQLESLGANMVVVLPGAMTTGGARGGAGSASTLTVDDADAIAREAPSVSRVGYMVRQSAQAQYGDHNWTTSIQGVSPAYMAIVNWRVAEGEPLSQQHDDAAARVGLIGQTVYQNLFGAGVDPVGAVILVKGAPIRVIGLLAAKGQTGFGQDQDDVILIPFTTAERKVLGVATPFSQADAVSAAYPPAPNPFGLAARLTGYVNVIYVQAAGPSRVDPAIAETTRTLSRRHPVPKGEPEAFGVRNLSQIAQAQEGSSRVMAALLALVASISLLVGGIGIMNILLVSVTERTREIGIRMAIGARRLQVLLQFLAEAVLLSLAGGAAGVAAGVLASLVIAGVAHWPVRISVPAIAGGFAFSAGVGMFFGYYPARKAARLNPIDALRYE